MDWKREAVKREKNLIGDLQQLIAIPSVLDENWQQRMHLSDPNRNEHLIICSKKDVKKGLS